jgi:hypothetical protein
VEDSPSPRPGHGRRPWRASLLGSGTSLRVTGLASLWTLGTVAAFGACAVSGIGSPPSKKDQRYYRETVAPEIMGRLSEYLEVPGAKALYVEAE